jgi:hypothetical protein
MAWPPPVSTHGAPEAAAALTNNHWNDVRNMAMMASVAMDEDQDFEALLREWAKERIWPTV